MSRIPGLYQLLIRLMHPTRIRVGRLGEFDFAPGFYIYTGSAMGGLEQRIARHRGHPERLRWHIDYLLRHANLQTVLMERTSERRECALNGRAIAAPGAQIPVRGFGSSDCRCPAHLVYLGPTLSPEVSAWFTDTPR